MEIKGLSFVKTCGAYPGQYDVYDKLRNMVGYVRLRCGGLTCEYPEACGEIIYSASVADGTTGMFEDHEQRISHPSNIVDVLLEKIYG